MQPCSGREQLAVVDSSQMDAGFRRTCSGYEQTNKLATNMSNQRKIRDINDQCGIGENMHRKKVLEMIKQSCLSNNTR